jgi:hypothetical protein
VKLEVVRIAKRDFFGRPAPNTAVTVEATNTTTNKILKPRNQRVWGYQHGSDVGGMYSVGAALRDSFGNEYNSRASGYKILSLFKYLLNQNTKIISRAILPKNRE